VQFIGGEPTLNKGLAELVRFARTIGYEFVEVFSNLTYLSEKLIGELQSERVAVATSVYGPEHRTHDGVTRSSGSFHRTVRSIKKLLAVGVPVRVGIIEMALNEGKTAETRAFLESIGVTSIGGDRVRDFGRGASNVEPDMSQLCGACAGGTLCVGPDGRVSPCIMSKAWHVGSAIEDGITRLLESDSLTRVRAAIRERTRAKIGNGNICDPKTCSPYDTCTPKLGPGPCAPSGCNPCYPNG
jgi:MoaA/NifB/PqqE/SkfB family radical SAM enzyme